MKSPSWHNLKIEKVFSTFRADKSGLRVEKAKERLKKYGHNALPEKKKLSKTVLLISQFKSPLVYILLVASIISLVLQNWVDLGVILFVVIMNALVGFIQENKANNALYLLKKIVTFKAKVLRNKQEVEIDSKDLVVGDIIFLEAGDRVPADIRLFETNDLQANEASLTGEALPSEKRTGTMKKGTPLADRENMVFMGTNIVRGKGIGIVCQTGIRTEIGKIASLVKETQDTLTPLQIQLRRFSQLLTKIVLTITAIILVFGYIKGIENILYVVVALAVAAIPEGLLIAVTLILTIGMQAILRKKALVRKLVAAETLGSTSVICMDKTGTITEGRMRVAQIITENVIFETKDQNLKQHREAAKSIFTIATLCNDAVIENPDKQLEEWSIIGDPMEGALILAAVQAGINKQELEKRLPRKNEIPFSSEKKFMATMHSLDKKNDILYIKGAPEVILSMAKYYKYDGKKGALSEEKRKALKTKYEGLSKKGLRLLAFAEKTIAKDSEISQELFDTTFIGFIALKDPIRKEAKETLQVTKMAGIRTIVITGDHKLTAKTIVEEMGMKLNDQNIMLGEQLDKISDTELLKRVEKISLYARVSPEHKLRIINAWQKKNHVVAMTGDGVNDAPAIKKADIGIALNSGTDVAKQTSDLVLLDNNFKTIVEAIKQGRIIFDNIRKVIIYLLGDSWAEIVLVSAALLFGLPLPILPAQILWVNLIDDGPPTLAMTLEPGEKEVIYDKPRKKTEPVLSRQVIFFIAAIGICINIVTLYLFYHLLNKHYEIEYIRTMIFTLLAIKTLFYSLSVRSMRHSIFTKNFFSNRFLLYAVFGGMLLQALAIYEPHLQSVFQTVSLGLKDWMVLLVLAIVIVGVIEMIKHLIIIRNQRYAAAKVGSKT